MRPEHADRPDFASFLAHRVRERRKALALTQATLAVLAGCDPRFVRDLEQGKPTLRMDKVLDLLSALGLRLEVGEE